MHSQHSTAAKVKVADTDALIAWDLQAEHPYRARHSSPRRPALAAHIKSAAQ
jgi:hypothetical protein